VGDTLTAVMLTDEAAETGAVHLTAPLVTLITRVGSTAGWIVHSSSFSLDGGGNGLVGGGLGGGSLSIGRSVMTRADHGGASRDP